MPRAGEPRMTIATQLALRALLEDPRRELYGVEIGRAAGLPSGTVHPILARLEGIGWLESSWEDIDPRVEGRPQRRHYRLTANGVESSRQALARAYTGRISWRPAADGARVQEHRDVDPRHVAGATALRLRTTPVACPRRWCVPGTCILYSGTGLP